jgi:hypothetical protein
MVISSSINPGPLQLAIDLGQFALGRRSRGEGLQAPGRLLFVDGAGDRFGRQQVPADVERTEEAANGKGAGKERRTRP